MATSKSSSSKTSSSKTVTTSKGKETVQQTVDRAKAMLASASKSTPVATPAKVTVTPPKPAATSSSSSSSSKTSSYTPTSIQALTSKPTPTTVTSTPSSYPTTSSSILSKYGGSNLSAPGSPLKPAIDPKTNTNVLWGIPAAKSPFDTYVAGKTANSTAASAQPPAAITRSGGGNVPTVTPASPANTNTTGTTLSPAGKTYAQQLEEIKQKALGIQSLLNTKVANEKAGVATTSTVGSTTGTTATETQEETDFKNSPEYKAYLKYIREQQNPSEASNTAKERADALKVLADVQKRKEQADTEARRRYEKLLDESGMLKSGAEQSASVDRRRSNQELADIALQESAAARTAGVYDDIYQNEQEQNRPLTIEEASILGVPFGTTMNEARGMGVIPDKEGGKNDGFSLGKDQTRWEYDAATGQYKQVAAGAEAGEGGAGATITPYMQERITRNLSSLDDLEGQVSNWNTGMGSLLSIIPGTPAANFKADVEELAANISFGELTAMREASKTGGALGSITERELQLLQSALGSLDRAQSPAQFKKSLGDIRDSINRWTNAMNQYGGDSAGGGGETVTLPNGTVINTSW